MDAKNKVSTFLSFTLGKEEFAIDVRNVVKILEMRNFTKVPQSPKYLKGIINIGGKVIPVFNAYYKFGFLEHQKQSDSVIIIMSISFENEIWEAGIIVEKANEVFEADEGSIKEYPALGNESYENLITGVIKHKDHFILILDVNRMFAKEEISQV
jgi:purine-binding chemotaxis protein CheW